MLKNDVLFKVSDHKYKLIWTGGTTAVDVNLNDISNTHIKYKPFAEIVFGKWRPDLLFSKFTHQSYIHDSHFFCLFVFPYVTLVCLFFFFVDVIGVVQDMGYCQLNEGKKLQVNFTMKDIRFSYTLVIILQYLLPYNFFLTVFNQLKFLSCYDS